VIIDPIDLKIIRLLELHGIIPLHEIISKFQISKQEIFLRIKNFEETGFIEEYALKLFLPAIMGGRWYWGCIAAETTDYFRAEKAVPCLDEIVENLTFPKGVCPNVSLLFYTRKLKETYRIINKTPGVKYAEIYKIDSYDIRMPTIMVQEGWPLISGLYDRLRQMDYEKINTLVNDPVMENDIKLSRMIWTKKNRKGIISIFPAFNWSLLKNYAHLHLGLTSKLRVKELRKIINRIGFSGNITSRFKKTYLQVEFDIWGFSDLQKIFNTLGDIAGITVEGYSLAHKNIIRNAWIKKYIEDNI
jgi:DNA-binding Lrp family transcriptional regulator